MALDPGDAEAGTGLAGAMAAAFAAGSSQFDVKKGAPMINALAEAIVDYIVANAEVTVTGVTAGGDSAPGTIL